AGQRAHHHVVRAAWPERNDETNRAARVDLGRGGAGGESGGEGEGERGKGLQRTAKPCLHGVSVGRSMRGGLLSWREPRDGAAISKRSLGSEPGFDQYRVVRAAISEC